MKTIKIITAICLFSILTIFIYSCSKSDNNNSSGGGGDSNTNMVTIQSMQFQPGSITVTVGSKTTWTNKDAEAHTVTSDDGSSFNSGTINSQGTYSFTASQTGVYAYHCALHPEMHGTLVVVAK